MLVTGEAASARDFTDRLQTSTPLVIAFVLGLALLLLLASFRSLPLALAVIGLNLLSVGAAYGVLTAVFQNTWAESYLDFTSSGTIADWVPLNTFVILFGLSMDYTILVSNAWPSAAAPTAHPATPRPRACAPPPVPSPPPPSVMGVAIFAIFPTLPLIEMKMMGVALAAAVPDRRHPRAWHRPPRGRRPARQARHQRPKGTIPLCSGESVHGGVGGHVET